MVGVRKAQVNGTRGKMWMQENGIHPLDTVADAACWGKRRERGRKHKKRMSAFVQQRMVVNDQNASSIMLSL
jgi:hypothetical protein